MKPPTEARSRERNEERVVAIRRFNRFYTQRIGVLQKSYLASRLGLTEARVLYEVAQRQQPTAAELSGDLGLDAGYLSRVLARFEKNGWLKRGTSVEDGRQRLLELTGRGRQVFEPLDERSRREVRALLDELAEPEQKDLVKAMERIESLLGGEKKSEGTCVILRQHRPGDMGWVIQRHAQVYFEEYGWGAQFEALVAKIAGEFLERFDPSGDRCWIAERNGEAVGCVFVVRATKTVAQLRLLLVERRARGLGLGKQLVNECIRFARQAGYRKMRLWTHTILTAARHIYEEAGFQLVETKPYHEFGVEVVGEIWELEL